MAHIFIENIIKRSKKPANKKRYGGFLQDIEAFDHQLFEVEQNRVMEMTPELRLCLETVWETFEDGGYTRTRLDKLRDDDGVGVFIGNMYNQYFWNIPSLEQAVLSSNGGDWHIANRVSHFLT